MSVIRYKAGYKYQLAQDYQVQLPIKVDQDQTLGLDIIEPFYSITVDGLLTVNEGYAWDGPSGPTFDTCNFMRGSLVHDVLYQMIREGHLPIERRVEADKILRDICLEDGMSRIRAQWVYLGVRVGGGNAAAPREKELLEAGCL